MIAHVRGVLVEKSLDRVVVEAGGVGYSLAVSLNTLAALPQPGHEVTVKTYLQVREDAHVLFGFATDEERRAFELCMSVSGIGPKLALSLLSSLRPPELADAVRASDVARLSKTPGVGKRTAERIVVELKDRIDKMGFGTAGGRAPLMVGGVTGRLGGTAATVASALTNLGYRVDEAERAAKEATAGRETLPIEQLLKEALRALTG